MLVHITWSLSDVTIISHDYWVEPLFVDITWLLSGVMWLVLGPDPLHAFCFSGLSYDVVNTITWPLNKACDVPILKYPPLVMWESSVVYITWSQRPFLWHSSPYAWYAHDQRTLRYLWSPNASFLLTGTLQHCSLHWWSLGLWSWSHPPSSPGSTPSLSSSSTQHIIRWYSNMKQRTGTSGQPLSPS